MGMSCGKRFREKRVVGGRYWRIWRQVDDREKFLRVLMKQKGGKYKQARMILKDKKNGI